MKTNTLVIVHSYHHKNTEKIAHAIAEDLHAEDLQAAKAFAHTLS